MIETPVSAEQKSAVEQQLRSLGPTPRRPPRKPTAPAPRCHPHSMNPIGLKERIVADHNRWAKWKSKRLRARSSRKANR